jgi:hypothetical protein
MYAGLYTGGSDDPEVLAGNGQPFLSANQAIALRTVLTGRNASITSSPRPGGGPRCRPSAGDSVGPGPTRGARQT